MKFLEKIVTNNDKRVVSARIPSVILDALESASEKVAIKSGLTFSTQKIIEMALLELLDEIESETNIDFLALEKYKNELRGLSESLEQKGECGYVPEFESRADEIISICENDVYDEESVWLEFSCSEVIHVFEKTDRERLLQRD